MIFYNRQNVKIKSFLVLWEVRMRLNCVNNPVRLSTSSKSRYSQTSDESSAVKLNRTRGRDVVWLWQTFFSKSGIFSCDVWHILQRLRHSLRFDKWHWLPSDVSPCQIYLCCPLLSPYFAVLGHLFGQFLRLGHHHCPPDKREGWVSGKLIYQIITD